MTLEETLISVWRQALVDQAGSVKLENQQFPVRQTTRSRLRQVDFRFRDQTVRGLEQNPVGTTRAARNEGHAISERRPLRCGRGRGESAVLRPSDTFSRHRGPPSPKYDLESGRSRILKNSQSWRGVRVQRTLGRKKATS